VSDGYRHYRVTCNGHPSAARAPGQTRTYVACNAGQALWVASSTGHGWFGRTRYGGSITDGPAITIANRATTFYAEAPDHSLWMATGRNRWYAAAFAGVSHGAGGS
jgi:hypothetical protein